MAGKKVERVVERDREGREGEKMSEERGREKEKVRDGRRGGRWKIVFWNIAGMENNERVLEGHGQLGHNVFNGHIDGEKLRKSRRKITKGMEMGVYGEK